MDDDPATAGADEVRARAVGLLARREHAPAELIHKLEKRGYSASTVERVVAELTDEDLVSEARYAESVAYTRTMRGYGPQRIRAELAARAVSEGAIEAAIAGLDVDWAASAATERRKRFGTDPPADFPAKARQMRFLQQRGFTSAQIQAAMSSFSPGRDL